MAVEVFLKGMKIATEAFLDDPLGVPMISNWSRVTGAIPDIFERLIGARWNATMSGSRRGTGCNG